MESGAAICMSVEAPREKPMMPAQATVISAASRWPPRPESPHVQINERHHDEGEAGRGQAGAPVVDAELLKDEHGAPVVEGGLLQPGAAVEIGRNAGAQPPLSVCGGVEADQHLVGDLRIAGLVGAHQAEAVAAQQRG